MQKSKLLRILNSLSKKELRDLERFIHSDYFKVAASSKTLFAGLVKYKFPLVEENIDKEKLWKKIYPKKDFSLKLFTNKMSDLTKEIERFLVIQSLEQESEKYQFQKLKAKAFKAHNLYGDFKKEVQQLLKEQQQATTIEGFSLYRELADLNHQFYFHAKNHKIELKNFSFDKIWQGHQHLSLLGNLIYGIEAINRNQILGKPIDFLPNNLLTDSVLQKNANHPLLLQLYIQLYQLITANHHSLQKFDEVADTIIANLKSVDFENKEILLLSLSNYLTKRIYDGATEFKTKIFKIFYTLHEEGVFTKYGSLGENTFLNMINASLHYKEVAWTQNFIKEAIPKLEISIRERVAQLGWVYFYFGTKQYEKAIKKLIIQKGTNHLFKVRMRSLSIRIYYEVSLTDPTYFPTFFNACTQFTNFLKKEKAFTQNKKISYLNFTTIIRRLGKWKHQLDKQYDKERKFVLLDKLNNMEQVALKEWLSEKIKE